MNIADTEEGLGLQIILFHHHTVIWYHHHHIPSFMQPEVIVNNWCGRLNSLSLKHRRSSDPQNKKQNESNDILEP